MKTTRAGKISERVRAQEDRVGREKGERERGRERRVGVRGE